MNDWLNEWMDEWMDGWMDEWINESMDEWMNEWMNDLMDKWMNEWMSTKNNFFKSLAVSHNFGPTIKMSPKLRKPVLIVKILFGTNFSFQRDVYQHFEENKLQWGIASHKLLVF